MTKWYSAVEIDHMLDKSDISAEIFDLYCASLFAKKGFLAQDFEPSHEWQDHVALSDSGVSYLQQMHEKGIKFDQHVEIFVLFSLFYHRDLLIDIKGCNYDRIVGLLEEMHDKKTVKFPYVFGNALYHKFNDFEGSNQTKHLGAELSRNLLEDTPQGIFQTGKLICGPLGFCSSLEERIILPTLSVSLWHCSDPGCRTPHQVSLQQFNNNFLKARSTMGRFIVDELGPPSEWQKPILRIYRKDKWPGGRPYYDLLALISECIIGNERDQLLVRCLQSKHNQMISEVILKKKELKGNPITIARQLNSEEQLQLIMLLPDEDIVFLLDELIFKHTIKIPPSETRSPTHYPPGPSADTSSEISSLGVRSFGHPPIVSIVSSVCRAYEKLKLTDELSWKLRAYTDLNVFHSLIRFIRVEGAQKAVINFILSSQIVSEHICKELNFQIMPSESENSISERILWKFGFDISRYENELFLLRERLVGFKDCVLRLPMKLSEDDRACIRATGVNLFVSVEDFIEKLVCYNVWLMASDHFMGSNFIFDMKEAKIAVGKIIGQEIISGDEKIFWSTTGNNTLGCLLSYLNAFRNWIKQLNESDCKNIKRPEEEYPHFSDDPYFIFPFIHLQLWADASGEVVAEYAGLIEKIYSQLAQADLTYIRNGLDHKRDDDAFPTPDKMLACIARLEQVIDLADAKRLYPKLYWITKRETDVNGNVCHTFSDYRGNLENLWDPSFMLGSNSRSYHNQLIYL